MLDFNGAPDRLWWGGEVSEVYSGSDLVWSADAGQYIYKRLNAEFPQSWRELGKVTLDEDGYILVGLGMHTVSDATSHWRGRPPQVQISSGGSVSTTTFREGGAFHYPVVKMSAAAGTWTVKVRQQNPSGHTVVSAIVSASSSLLGWDIDTGTVGGDLGYKRQVLSTHMDEPRLVVFRGDVSYGSLSVDTPHPPQIVINGSESAGVYPGPTSFWQVVTGQIDMGVDRNLMFFFAGHTFRFTGRLEYTVLPEGVELP